MSASTKNKLIGAALVLAALGVDVALTLTGHPVPSLIASIVTAGLGLVTGSVLSSSQADPVEVTPDTPTDPPPPPPTPRNS